MPFFTADRSGSFYSEKAMKNKLQRILFFLLTGGLVTGVMLVCSLATSPIYPHNFSYDSAFFRFFGTEILKGKTPYTDVWDNKGPVLFFIQALGALGGTTNKGTNILFLMQLLSAYFSVFCFWQITGLLHGEKLPRWKFFAFLICTSAVFSLTIESGNLSEEWCLPMTCLSFWLLIKYAVRATESPEHPRRYAFLHGIGLGMMTLIRANNAFPVCAGLIVVGIWLIRKKQWKNIFTNILFGILGIACIWMPVFVWFYARGALDEMLYAVFQFNLKYTGMRSFIHYTGEPLVTRYLPIAAAAVILCAYWIRVRTFSLTDMITAAVLAVGIWMLSETNVYLHYFTVFVPILFLVLIRCGDRLGIPEWLLLLGLCGWFGVRNAQRLPDLISLHRQPQMFTAAEKIPEEERDSVIAVNMPPEIYLNYGLEPVSRFCAYQHVHFGVAPELKTEFLKTISEDRPPLWILAFCSGETNIPEVQDLIDRSYIYKFDQSDICYYRLGSAEE